MIKLLADENFNNNIIRGLQRIKSNIDIMRIQDIGLAGSHDIEILEWAAKNKRVLLTHDVTTITKYAYQRIVKGLSMPGVFEIKYDIPIGKVIDDILLLYEYSDETEWEGQIRYFPL